MFYYLINIMMYKNSQQLLLFFAAVIALMFVTRTCRRSNYKLSPSTLDITSSASNFKDIFSLPYSIDCVPGPTAKGSYYTKDLTPGGICGAQEFVRSQAEDYKIVDGIGGSLLNQ